MFLYYFNFQLQQQRQRRPSGTCDNGSKLLRVHPYLLLKICCRQSSSFDPPHPNYPHTTEKAARADQIVNGSPKYGGEGVVIIMVMLYIWMWENEYTPKRWRKGVVVNFFKKEHKADPGKCRGIALLSTVGKTFSKNLNVQVGTMLEEVSDQIVVA